MTAEERLLEWGYEDVIIFTDYSYDDALIGVTTDNRAVYDYDLMVDWLCREERMDHEGAVEWIEFNTLRALPYAGDLSPIVIHKLN